MKGGVFILDFIKDAFNNADDINSLPNTIYKHIEKNYLLKSDVDNIIKDYDNKIHEMDIKNKKDTIINILGESGCQDLEFILYKYSSLLDDDILDDNALKNKINNIRLSHPKLFSKDIIDGISPPDGFDTVTISKDDFSKMSYGEKLKLYEQNKNLYDTLT
ncbi:MAG: hypothetical protein ACRCZK_06790 [Oscillospiraceae bacterium]